MVACINRFPLTMWWQKLKFTFFSHYFSWAEKVRCKWRDLSLYHKKLIVPSFLVLHLYLHIKVTHENSSLSKLEWNCLDIPCRGWSGLMMFTWSCSNMSRSWLVCTEGKVYPPNNDFLILQATIAGIQWFLSFVEITHWIGDGYFASYDKIIY